MESHRGISGAAAVACYLRIVEGRWPDGYPQALASVDGVWLAKYLSGCGLAGAMVCADVRAEWSQYAHPELAAVLEKRATGDALRELSHRDTLERLHEVAQGLGERAILLKGAAIYLRERAVGKVPLRVPGDIDIWLESPGAAEEFRRRLLLAGFSGDMDAPRTGPHHLAPVVWRYSAVEVHTAPMPSFWRLPDVAFSQRAIGLPGYPQFSTLGFSDMILHEAIHSTTHLWSFGLKLPRDIAHIVGLANGSAHPVDWNTLAECAGRTAAPMAFWAPLLALNAGLPANVLAVPTEFLSLAPAASGRLLRAVGCAADRIFTATDNADHLNPFTRNRIFLGLMPWATRARYLRDLCGPSATESRREAMSGAGGQSWRRLPQYLWEALREQRRGKE